MSENSVTHKVVNSLEEIPVPTENVILRNPNFGKSGDPAGLINCMVIQKIDDYRIDPGIERLVDESEYDPSSQTLYLHTFVDARGRGASSVINDTIRTDVIRQFTALKGWFLEVHVGNNDSTGDNDNDNDNDYINDVKDLSDLEPTLESK